MQIRENKLIEGIIALSFLSGAGVFIGFVQVGLKPNWTPTLRLTDLQT